MAADLALTIDRQEGGAIRVAWQDYAPTKIAALKERKPLLYGLIGLTVIAPPFGLVGLLIAWLTVSRMIGNAVTFDPENTRHKDAIFPTDRITRIEYGSMSQLTGETPRKADGTPAPDLTIIRLWLDDSHAHEISRNYWQNQVSHKIRDALSAALDEVRKGKAKEERTQKFGDQGDFGMPDY